MENISYTVAISQRANLACGQEFIFYVAHRIVSHKHVAHRNDMVTFAPPPTTATYAKSKCKMVLNKIHITFNISKRFYDKMLETACANRIKTHTHTHTQISIRRRERIYNIPRAHSQFPKRLYRFMFLSVI